MRAIGSEVFIDQRQRQKDREPQRYSLQKFAAIHRQDAGGPENHDADHHESCEDEGNAVHGDIQEFGRECTPGTVNTNLLSIFVILP